MPKQTEFKIGDRVRDTRNGYDDGKVGRVQEPQTLEDGTDVPVMVWVDYPDTTLSGAYSGEVLDALETY